ncbi:hypothetical protein B0T20DRAFT_393784 [Sordaria brevicollis]|uniref:Uncharacterized protein n=1 Tax=Sordaria brevicollis TaxID=83679 RepID=A0AAE0PDN8_SORBR|nr:hypothetical protein B0T20DRAFT_393784 [Sordaria brevicollis]
MEEMTAVPERPSGRVDLSRPSSAEEVITTSLSPPGSRFKPPKPKDVKVYEKKPLPPIPPKRRPEPSTSSQKDLNSAKGVHTSATITGAGPPKRANNRHTSGNIDWEKEEAEINSIIAKQLTPRSGTPVSASASPAPRTPKSLKISPETERAQGSGLSQEIISPQPRSPVSNLLQLDSFGHIKSRPDSPPLSPTRQGQNTKVNQILGPDYSSEQRRGGFSNSEHNATGKHTTGYISPVSSRSSYYSQYRDSTVSEAGSASLVGSGVPLRHDSPVTTEYSPKGKPPSNISNRLIARGAPSPIPRPLQPRKVSDHLKGGGGNETTRTMSPVPSTTSDHGGISSTDARDLYHETAAQIARNTGGSWTYPNALSHPPHPGSSIGIPSHRSAGGPGHARFLSEAGTPPTTSEKKRESQEPLLSPPSFIPVPQQPPPVRPPRKDELPLSLPRWGSATDTLVPPDSNPKQEGESPPRSRPRSNSQSSRGSHHSQADGTSSPSSQNAALKTRPRNRAQTISVSTFGHHNELRRQWDSGSPQLEVGGPALPLGPEDNLAIITEFAKHGSHSHHTRNHSDGDYLPSGGSGGDGSGENRTSLFRRSLVSKVFRRVSGSTAGGGTTTPSTPTPTSTPSTTTTSTPITGERSQTAAERYHDQSSKSAIASIGTTTPLVYRPRTADSSSGAAGPPPSFSPAVGFILPQTLKMSALAQKTNDLLVGGRLARKNKSEKKRENLKNSIRVMGDGGRVEAPVDFVTGMELLSPPERPARQDDQGWL